MSDELVIRGKRGDFNDYEKFITKFKATKTTDDCYLLSSKAATERVAAERAAAEVVKLTPQELRMIDELDGKIKPFYDQTLF